MEGFKALEAIRASELRLGFADELQRTEAGTVWVEAQGADITGDAERSEWMKAVPLGCLVRNVLFPSSTGLHVLLF
jgi:hypothetical protein